MKSLPRNVMWWPRIDAHIEALAKACTSCKAVKSAPSQPPLHLWWWPEFPWQRVHMNLLVLPWEDVYVVDERSFQVARDLRNDFHNG